MEEVMAERFSPIDNALRGKNMQLLTAQIEESSSNSETIDFDEELFDLTIDEIVEAEIRAQMRSYIMAQSFAKLMCPAKDNEINRFLSLLAYCQNVDAPEHQGHQVELTRKGRGILLKPVPVKLYENIGDILGSSGEEQFKRFLGSCYDCGGKIEGHSTQLVYVTPASYGDRPLVKRLETRVKTRESFLDKLTDIVTNINTNKKAMYDFTAFRAFSPTEKRCRDVIEALKHLSDKINLVEGYIENRFDNPKPNGYRDLKVLVTYNDGPDNGDYLLVHEFQLVTPEIHKLNEESGRKHEEHKIEKLKQRLEIGEQWYRLRVNLGRATGEESSNHSNPLQLMQEAQTALDLYLQQDKQQITLDLKSS